MNNLKIDSERLSRNLTLLGCQEQLDLANSRLWDLDGFDVRFGKAGQEARTEARASYEYDRDVATEAVRILSGS